MPGHQGYLYLLKCKYFQLSILLPIKAAPWRNTRMVNGIKCRHFFTSEGSKRFEHDVETSQIIALDKKKGWETPCCSADAKHRGRQGCCSAGMNKMPEMGQPCKMPKLNGYSDLRSSCPSCCIDARILWIKTSRGMVILIFLSENRVNLSGANGNK